MAVGLTARTFSKRAAADDRVAAERLRHEADVLTRLPHPGVVELVGLEEDPADGTLELTTGLVDGVVLSDWAGGADTLAPLAARLATTVADLHDLGVAHGRLSADHVLVDAAGRPVLCGFSQSVDADAPSCAADVAALGRLILAALPPDGPTSLATLRTRSGGSAGGRSTSSPQPAALDRLARQAMGEAVPPQPSARQLADALWDVVETSPSPRTTAAPRPSRSTATMAVAVAVAAAALASVVVIGGHRLRRHHVAAAWPVPSSSPPTVDIGGHRFEVGHPGDRVVTGRFDCQTLRPAVVTPSGDVFVFDDIAQPGADTTARFVTHVESLRSVTVTEGQGDTCDALAVTLADGTRQTISMDGPA